MQLKLPLSRGRPGSVMQERRHGVGRTERPIRHYNTTSRDNLWMYD